jgi:hypothetical protein
MPRAKRTCSDCPRACTGPRCPVHAAAYELARGNRQERGYDGLYDAARREAAKLVLRGRAVCWRCGEPIVAGTPWDLGHDDEDGRVRGPEHAGPCNRRAAGLKAHGLPWTPPEAG